MKVEIKTSPSLYPSPLVLVTAIDSEGKANIITLTWAANLCSKPPIIGIGVGSESYSCNLIGESKEFVVNIPPTKLLPEVEFCGETSGKDVDKFARTKLTPIPSKKVKPPAIKECPMNIECKVLQQIKLGMQDLFLGEVIAVQVDKDILDEKGEIDFKKTMPIIYNIGEYWELGEKIGSYGITKGKI